MAKYAGVKTNGCDSKFESGIEGILVRSVGVRKNKDIKLEYTIKHKYIPDFVVGNTIIEAKGYFKPSDRAKMKAVRDAHPQYRFVLAFQNAYGNLSGTKGTNADWAEKNGFDWCHAGVKREWLV